jgi:subtilisin family serine protease
MEKLSSAKPICVGFGVLMLAACSGGGATSPSSSGATTVPAPITVGLPPPRTPVAPPAAPAPAQPASVFDTAEYRTNAKLALFDPISAYSRGFTGRGVTLAVLDTGVDTDSAEFAGRLATGSANFLPAGVLNDTDGHGTAVSSVILGAKNNAGTHGVAYDATLFSGRILSNFLRSRQTPPTRAEVQQENVDFYSGFALGLNAARNAGAQAVNLSIGFESVTVSNPGAPPPPSAPLDNAVAAYDAAIQAAYRDKLVFVIAAGNSGTLQPNSFPRQILAAAPLITGEAPVLIVGALGEDGQTLATFSDRAGTALAANYYIAAPGVRIAAPDDTGAVLNFSGTSLAAPHVTGALALLLQAFPNLTATRAADLLLTTATDLGAPGTDPIFGRGALNIARAFQPQGGQSIAISTGRINLTPTTNSLFIGSAIGDISSLRSAVKDAIFQDSYDRVFQADLSREIIGAPVSNQTLQTATQARETISSQLHSNSFSFAASAQKSFDGKQIASFQTALQADILPGLRFWLNSGRDKVAPTLLATQHKNMILSDGIPLVSTGLNFSAGDIEFGGSWQKGLRRGLVSTTEFNPAQSVDLSVAHKGTNHYLKTSLRSVAQNSVSNQPNLLLGSNTKTRALIAEITGSKNFGAIRLSATAQLGRFKGRAVQGLITDVSSLWSSAFAAQLLWQLDAQQNITFGVAQPQRIESGALTLQVPTQFNYQTGQSVFSTRTIELSPRLREIDLEINYRLNWRDILEVRSSLYQRFNPAHQNGNDIGAFISVSTQF